MAYLYCFIGIFLFSTMEVISKKLQLPPYPLTVWRFLIGGLILLPVAIAKGQFNKLRGKDYLIMGLGGVLNVALAMNFLQLAVTYGKAGITAILISVNPVFVGVLAWILLKERLTWQRQLGLGLGLAGLLLIVGQEGLHLAGDSAKGLIYGLAAPLTFALYTVYSKKHIKTYGNLVFNSVSFILGGLVLAAWVLFKGQSVAMPTDTTSLLALGWMGIFVTGLAYVAYFYGVTALPTVTGSMFFFLKPFIASLLAWYVLKEQPGWLVWVGIALVITGVYLEPLIKLFKPARR